jgi:hypothetical protein
MAYNVRVCVKYQGKGSPPLDMRNMSYSDEIASATGEYIPLPNVDDIIDCKHVGGAVGGQTSRYRVRMRCLTYAEGHCTVFLIVTDLEEKAPRRVTQRHAEDEEVGGRF